MDDLPITDPYPSPRRTRASVAKAASAATDVASTVLPFPASTTILAVGKVAEGFFGGRLSEGEARRSDIAGQAAIDSIYSRILGGEKVRPDWEWGLGSGSRRPAQEVFEAALGHACRQYEEKKARHFGWAFAGMCFDSSYSAPEAHHALRIADSLSYRQLCVMGFLLPGATSKGPRFARDRYYIEGEEPSSPELVSLLQEIFKLVQEELVAFRFTGDGHSRPISGFGSVLPSHLSLTSEGIRYAKVLRLDLLDSADLAATAGVLS